MRPGRSEPVTRNIQLALVLVALGTLFSVASLLNTTALTMTLFFSVGVPAFAIAGLLYVVEVLRDLRRHRVL
jgi:hypothetical protein